MTGRRMRPAAGAGRRVAAALTVVLVLTGAGTATAQEPLAGCEEGGTELDIRCRSVAVGMLTARAALGLAAAGGTDLAGTNSTLGKRIGNAPRLALAVRGNLVRAPLADLDAAYDQGGTGWVRGLRVSGSAGVFNGFSVAPTVGGILAVDLLVDLSLVSGSSGDGFGDALMGYGVGARVGVFRESFTLPGVTLTATRRWLGTTRYGTFGDDDFESALNRGAEFETTVTSVRGVVGKDLFAIGFLAGAGWDRYQGDGRVVSNSGQPPNDPPRVAVADGFTSDRMLFFGGVSYNFLVLQLSAEGGWAEGLGDARSDVFGGPERVPDDEGLADLGRSTWWGSVAFRLVL